MEMRKEYAHPFAATCLASISTCQSNVPIESWNFPLPFLRLSDGHPATTPFKINLQVPQHLGTDFDLEYQRYLVLHSLWGKWWSTINLFWEVPYFQPTPCLHDPLAAHCQAANPRSEERRRLIGTISCQPRSRIEGWKQNLSSVLHMLCSASIGQCYTIQAFKGAGKNAQSYLYRTHRMFI